MADFTKMNSCIRRAQPSAIRWTSLLLVLTSISSVNGQPSFFGGSERQVEVKTQVISQYDPVGPDQTFLVAVVLDIQPTWHLYPNPIKGEAIGLPTSIVPLSTSELSVLNIFYPPGVPYQDKVFKSVYDVYEGKVTLFIEVKTNDDVGPEHLLPLQLAGSVCGGKTGSCIPWEETVSIQIPTTSNPEEIREQQPQLFETLDRTRFTKVALGSQKVANGESVNTNSGVTQDSGITAVVMPDYQAVEYDDSANLSAGDWVTPLLLALVAGVILNLMPCVLPVIPIKVLSLIQQAQSESGSQDRFKAVKLSLVFSLGIVLVFVVLGVVMSGFGLFYGQQFQSLAFKFVMLMIVFVLSLSMMGLFEVSLPLRVSNIAVVREGYLGAFGMGLLATLLATPCSAPLLGPVLTWSLSRPPAVTMMVFLVIGIGMAAPYMLLTAFPGLMNKVPKAGPWMIRLKQGLSIVMLGVSTYLVFLFPASWHLPLIVFCLILTFAIWLGWQVVGLSSTPTRKVWARGIALGVMVGGSVLSWQWVRPRDSGIEAAPFSQEKLLALHDKSENVMVEFTADWCPNCKVVELTVLSREVFKRKLKETNTQLLIADWTEHDPLIKDLLAKLGSHSIPFTAVFPGNDPLKPFVLRDIYTLDSILDVLEKVDQS